MSISSKIIAWRAVQDSAMVLLCDRSWLFRMLAMLFSALPKV
ncbi:hypothetical protein [Moraxella lacunata]